MQNDTKPRVNVIVSVLDADVEKERNGEMRSPKSCIMPVIAEASE